MIKLYISHQTALTMHKPCDTCAIIALVVSDSWASLLEILVIRYVTREHWTLHTMRLNYVNDFSSFL